MSRFREASYLSPAADPHPDRQETFGGRGQLGVVTVLRLDTVPESIVLDIGAAWADAEPAILMTAWQASAPDAPEARTRKLIAELSPALPGPIELELGGPMPHSALERTLTDAGRSSATEPARIRSERSPPLSSYSAPGGLRQGPRRAAESSAQARAWSRC